MSPLCQKVKRKRLIWGGDGSRFFATNSKEILKLKVGRAFTSFNIVVKTEIFILFATVSVCK